MAKAKKQEKPIEQRLEEALVLYEKTPYELPSNWCWVNFTAIIDIKGGNQPPKSEFVEDLRDGYIRFIQIRDYTSDKFKTYIPIKKNLTIVDEEDILIARYGASLGKICRGIAGACNVALAKTIFNKNYLCPDYLFYLLKTEVFQTPLSLLSRTAQAGFNKNDLEHFKFPLAPLEEQKRIVEIIEKQFAKLDEARDLIQASLDSFADRKSAILHKAFTGELTKKWREGKGIQYISWQKTKIKEVCKPRAGYAFDSNKFTSNGYQIVRMGNLYGGKLDLNRNPVFIGRQDIDESILNKALLSDGDILISLTGTKYKRDYGYAVKIIGDNNLLVNQRILCLTPKENIVPNFVLYYLQSEIFRDIFFSNETGGVNQGNVSSRFVENIELLLPSRMEQEEIVRILDSIFEKEDKSKELLDMLDKIDEMKKSILARAFRSQLGTSNPTDEPATDLLRKILAQSN